MGCTSSADDKKKRHNAPDGRAGTAYTPAGPGASPSPPAQAAPVRAAAPQSGAGGGESHGAARSGYKKRGKIPGPDCSAQELAKFLATYTMMPAPLAAGQAEEDPEDVRTRAKYNPGRRKTVADAPYNAATDDAYTPKDIRKQPAEIETLLRVLPSLPMFSHLDERELETIVKSMDRGVYREGQRVIELGASNGDEDRMYIIAQGQAQLLQNERSRPLTRGEVFGELELLFMQPRAATVIVESAELKTWELTRGDYRHLLRAASIRKRKLYLDLLRRISFLTSMKDDQMIQLADCLQASNYRNGEKLIEFDSDGEWMYIILEGTVEVIGRDQTTGEPCHVVDFGPGSQVGELEFINNHRCVADVVAKGPIRTAKLNRNHFELCMGPVMEVLKKNASASNPTYDYYNQARAH